jgi:hypothetical protein
MRNAVQTKEVLFRKICQPEVRNPFVVRPSDPLVVSDQLLHHMYDKMPIFIINADKWIYSK